MYSTDSRVQFQLKYRLKSFKLLLWKLQLITENKKKALYPNWQRDYSDSPQLYSIYGILFKKVVFEAWHNANVLENAVRLDTDTHLLLEDDSALKEEEDLRIDNANYSKVYTLKLLIIFLHELFNLNQLVKLNKKTNKLSLVTDFNFFKTHYTIPVVTWAEVNRVMKLDKTAVELFSLQNFVQKHQYLHEPVNLNSVRGLAFILFYFSFSDNNFSIKKQASDNINLKLTLTAGLCFRTIFSHSIRKFLLDLEY
jgi:hypothetical protein